MGYMLAYHEDPSSTSTYMKPRPKMMVKMIFLRRVIWSLHTSGIGRERIAISNSMLIMASARIVADEEPQTPGRSGFQVLAKGRHKRNSWRTTPKPKHTTTAAKVKFTLQKVLLMPKTAL